MWLLCQIPSLFLTCPQLLLRDQWDQLAEQSHGLPIQSGCRSRSCWSDSGEMTCGTWLRTKQKIIHGTPKFCKILRLSNISGQVLFKLWWHDQFDLLTYQLSIMVGKCANRRAYTPPERLKYTLFQAQITTTTVQFGQFPSRLKFTMTWGASKNSFGVCKRCGQTATNLYIGYNFKC